MFACQVGGHDVTALRVEADMKFAPCFTGVCQPVLLRHPIPATVNPQACAIHNERDRAAFRLPGLRHFRAKVKSGV